jgi:hypothetical protein
MTISEILAQLRAWPIGPNCWMARCPAHEDRSASLLILKDQGGPVLLHCSFGCPVDAVLGCAGLWKQRPIFGAALSKSELRNALTMRGLYRMNEPERKKVRRAALRQIREMERTIYAVGRYLAAVPNGEKAEGAVVILQDFLNKLRMLRKELAETSVRNG